MKNNLASIIGNNIKAIRDRKKISQADLAKKIGGTFQQISKYERGENTPGSIKLNQLAQALGVDVSELTRAEGEPRTINETPAEYGKAFKPAPNQINTSKAFNKIIQQIFIVVKYSNASRTDRTSQPSTTTPQEITRPFLFDPSPETFQSIRALLFMGKADGQLREAECHQISQFLLHAQPEHRQGMYKYIFDTIRTIKPLDAKEYRKHIESRSQEQLTELRDWTMRIIGTQKTVHPFEEYLLDEIDKRINTAQVIDLDQPISEAP